MADRPQASVAIDQAPLPPSDDWLTAFFWQPISIYTREDAIDDGALVDVSEWAGAGPDGMLSGFTVPVAITRALWGVINLDAQPEARCAQLVRQRGESTRGRAHDVLWMASIAARQNGSLDRMLFPVLMTVPGKAGRPVRKRLDLEAVIDADGVTIGFPEEF